MPVSPATRTKYVERARKQLAFSKKWGRWAAALMFLCGTLFIAGAVFIAVFPQRFANMLVIPGQAAQNLIWLGVALGMVFGFMSMYLVFEGLHAFYHGIQAIRGDPVSQMLVEYHDALLSLMHDRTPSPLPDIDPKPLGGQSSPDSCPGG
jgi:hypothetical protein